MRTGLFGGTFDPIHVGHLIITETIRSDYPLDRICFIPAAEPPHKTQLLISDSHIRLQMVELAIQDHPGLILCDDEIKRGGVSYTLDTIRRLKRNKAFQNDELYLIIGADSLMEMHTWKSPDEILSSVRVLVADRPGFDRNNVKPQFLNQVEFIHAPLIDIASSEVRNRIRKGLSIRDWVPNSVETFIRENALYG